MSNYLYGIDGSMKCTGITIYDLDKKEFVYIGSFNTEKIYATRQYKGLYLNAIKLKKKNDWLLSLKEQFPPKVVAIERGFSRFNNSTQTIFRAHGIINLMFWDTPQFYYPPKSVKEAIYKGTATKPQLAKIIKNNYPHLDFQNEDESDSCAVAITYLLKNELIDFEKPVVTSKKKTKRKTKKKE
jgi:Holliday junction resolvasome RuvABC endonuclease subunit